MSTIIAANISDGTTSVASTYVVNGSAKVWAVVRQTGTLALLDSFNIGSIIDNDVGNTSYNFSISFSSSNYSAGYSTSNGNNFVGEETGRTASSIRLQSNQHDGTAEDVNHQNLQIHGDLA